MFNKKGKNYFLIKNIMAIDHTHSYVDLTPTTAIVEKMTAEQLVKIN